MSLACIFILRGRIEARRGATLHALLHDAEAIGELRSEDSDLEHVSLPGSDVPKLRRPAIRPLTPVKRLRIARIRLIAIDAGLKENQRCQSLAQHASPSCYRRAHG
jgi:hypothetical protein